MFLVSNMKKTVLLAIPALFTLAPTAQADVSADVLRSFLTDNNPAAASVPGWKLECLDALSGRLDDRDDIPAELLTLMQVDCRVRFESMIESHPNLRMRDLEDAETAMQAAQVAAAIRAEATMQEADNLRSDIAAAQAFLPELAATCAALGAILADATEQGLRLRTRTPRICDEGRAERLITDAAETLAAFENPQSNPRFGIRPSERLAEVLADAQTRLDQAQKELATAVADANAENAALAERLEAAKAEGEALAGELPALHENLNAACEAYGDLVSGMQPWGCVGRAQARHQQWLEESIATVENLTPEDVSQSTGSLRRAEGYFAKIREEITEAMADLEAARDAQ
jgi:hypothetical protein